MKTYRLLGLAALLALATGCTKDKADRIDIFANNMHGGNAKVWVDPASPNGATWVAGETIDLNGTPRTITANSGLSEDEIKNMVNDAQAHADEDKKRKDAVDTKNRAESMVFQLEKQLKEYGDKLPDSVKKPIEDDISKLKSAIDAKPRHKA